MKRNALLFVCLAVIMCFALTGNAGVYANRSQYNSPQEYAEITQTKLKAFSEAPSLSQLVATGSLPAVEDRLPESPVVVIPIDEVGKYGGTWRKYALGALHVKGPVLYDPLVRWAPDATSIEPNLAESWSIEDEARRFVFKLRQGVKWSDGTEFTADDIVFWYEDILLNKNLMPAIPNWMKKADQVGLVKKIDKYTVSFEFKTSHPFFLEEIATGRDVYAPAHYLSAFHESYQDANELQTLARSYNFDTWSQLFLQRFDYLQNTELPTLFSWQIKEPKWDERAIFVRNPYYWKVDTEGKQLPYIDSVRLEYVSSWDIAVLKLMGGEADMHELGLQLNDYPIYMENRDRGQYQVYLYPFTNVIAPAILFNQTVEDPILRDIFRDVRFRRAISLAIDREEINEMFFLGLCDISQPTVPKQSPLFREEFATAYTEFDVTRANELLDEMGLTWDDKGEWRLRPDGARLQIVVETRTPDEWIHSGEMLPGYFRAIGIDVDLHVRETSFLNERLLTNQHEIALMGYQTHPLLMGDNPFTMTTRSYDWAPLWTEWARTGGSKGEEPIPEVKELLQLVQRYMEAYDIVERNEIGTRIMQIHSENLWMVGVGGANFPLRMIAANHFKNIPDTNTLTGWDFGLFGYRHPEQYFLDK